MTIKEIFDKYNIKYKSIQENKDMQLFRIGETNVLVKFYDNNTYKFKREWYNSLIDNTEKYALLIIDKKLKKQYFMKFKVEYNWFSDGFTNCDKPELFIGKQMLDYSSQMNSIVRELMALSK